MTSSPQHRDDEHDPFSEFDRSQGAGAVRDPYPRFAELRRQSPVHQGTLSSVTGFVLDIPSMGLYGIKPEHPPYVAVSHAAVERVYRDAATFSSKTPESMGIELVMGHTILNMDDPEHRAYRGLVQQAFSRNALARWEHELIRPVIERHVDAFVRRGSADLVGELTFSFPLEIIAALLGLPEDDLDTFHRLAVELLLIVTDIERGLVASEKLGEYLAAIVAERRQQATDDIISVLAHAELDGQRLNDDEIVAFLRLLLPAGAETTYRSSSNLLFGLLSDRAQWEAIAADRDLIPQAIEEGLRWEPPLTMTSRTCVQDTVLEGVPVTAGSEVAPCIGAANHDETRWEDPDRFDILRPQRPHLAFAFGPHMCLGLHLARLETACLLHTLLDRLPDLRLDPDAEDTHITGLVFRAPARLPVVFST